MNQLSIKVEFNGVDNTISYQTTKKNHKILSAFLNNNIDDIVNIIEIGKKGIKTMVQESKLQSNKTLKETLEAREKELEQKHQKAIDGVSNDYEKTIATLKTEWQNTQNKLSIVHSSFEEYKKSTQENIKQEIESKSIAIKKIAEENSKVKIDYLHKTIDMFKKQNEDKKQTIEELRGQIEEVRDKERWIADKNLSILKEEKQKEKENLLKEIDELQKSLNIKNNSYKKGKEGENELESSLAKVLPTAKIEDTRNIAKRGDFIVETQSCKLMVESKNFKTNVNKTNITKFYRDVEEAQDIDGALLLSLYSGIAKKKHLSVEIVNNKPIIFIHKALADPNSILLAVNMVEQIKKQNICFTNNFAESYNNLHDILFSCSSELSRYKTTLTSRYNDDVVFIGKLIDERLKKGLENLSNLLNESESDSRKENKVISQSISIQTMPLNTDRVSVCRDNYMDNELIVTMDNHI